MVRMLAPMNKPIWPPISPVEGQKYSTDTPREIQSEDTLLFSGKIFVSWSGERLDLIYLQHVGTDNGDRQAERETIFFSL